MYLIKREREETYTPLSTLFPSLHVLSLEGFLSRGSPINIYTAQWVGWQAEDVMVGTKDEHGRDVIEHAPALGLTLTFTFSSRECGGSATLMRQRHKMFINYMCDDVVFLRTMYEGGKEGPALRVRTGYRPTLYDDRHIVGTLHLDAVMRKERMPIPAGELYIGVGDGVISIEDITRLDNVQHYPIPSDGDESGDYAIMVATRGKYVWICTTREDGDMWERIRAGAMVTAQHSTFFPVPMTRYPVKCGRFNCYRTANALASHTMSFTILLHREEENNI